MGTFYPDEDLNVGAMAIRMKFQKVYFKVSDTYKQVPSKLISYGHLPQKKVVDVKIFEGENCHLQFLLWTLQNM